MTVAELTPPKPQRLVLSQFPNESWARSLVAAFNQLSLQTTAALTVSGPRFKVLNFKTGAAVADSFPIDFPVDSPPASVRVALVIDGAPSATVAVGVLAQPLSGGKLVRVSNITGLLPNTAYSIRLALE